MYNSIAKNNIVYNEPLGIFISRSHSNQIYNNTVSNSGNGINVNSGSTDNKMYDNTIMNSNPLLGASTTNNQKSTSQQARK